MSYHPKYISFVEQVEGQLESLKRTREKFPLLVIKENEHNKEKEKEKVYKEH